MAYKGLEFSKTIKILKIIRDASSQPNHNIPYTKCTYVAMLPWPLTASSDSIFRRRKPNVTH